MGQQRNHNKYFVYQSSGKHRHRRGFLEKYFAKYVYRLLLVE